jgi:hypothetical protein
MPENRANEMGLFIQILDDVQLSLSRTRSALTSRVYGMMHVLMRPLSSFCHVMGGQDRHLYEAVSATRDVHRQWSQTDNHFGELIGFLNP